LDGRVQKGKKRKENLSKDERKKYLNIVFGGRLRIILSH